MHKTLKNRWKSVIYFGVGPFKSPTVIPRGKNINLKGSSIEIVKVLHLVVVQGHTEELRYEPLGLYACRPAIWTVCTRKTLHTYLIDNSCSKRAIYTSRFSFSFLSIPLWIFWPIRTTFTTLICLFVIVLSVKKIWMVKIIVKIQDS